MVTSLFLYLCLRICLPWFLLFLLTPLLKWRRWSTLFASYPRCSLARERLPYGRCGVKSWPVLGQEMCQWCFSCWPHCFALHASCFTLDSPSTSWCLSPSMQNFRFLRIVGECMPMIQCINYTKSYRAHRIRNRRRKTWIWLVRPDQYPWSSQCLGSKKSRCSANIKALLPNSMLPKPSVSHSESQLLPKFFGLIRCIVCSLASRFVPIWAVSGIVHIQFESKHCFQRRGVKEIISCIRWWSQSSSQLYISIFSSSA